jgi:competence protein ComEC
VTGGPADLRLVLPAAAGWAAGAALLGAPARAGLGVAGVLGLVALLTARRPAIAATVVAAAAVAFVTALHAGQVAAGPLPGLAGRGAVVTLDLRITGDPVVHAGRVSGSTLFSRSVTVPATAERVEAGGRTVRIRSPVLVIGRGDGWRTLLPSQRLRVQGRVAPPDRAGDLTAVVLADGPPDRVMSPSAVQSAAGSVRAGLRAAAGVLPAEPRGLLPGLVDGDVSGMPSGLVDDFRTAGLTHLTAVSGDIVRELDACTPAVGAR